MITPRLMPLARKRWSFWPARRRRRPALAEIVCTTHVFATAYAAVDHDLPRLFALKPDIILMFGLAGRRRQLCIETRARNAVSVLFPDASGYRPQRGVIVPDGEAALPGAAPFADLLGSDTRAPGPGPLVAGCRTILVQLRLLARIGARSRRPAIGSIRSYSAGQVEAAAAAAKWTSRPVVGGACRVPAKRSSSHSWPQAAVNRPREIVACAGPRGFMHAA